MRQFNDERRRNLLIKQFNHLNEDVNSNVVVRFYRIAQQVCKIPFNETTFPPVVIYDKGHNFLLFNLRLTDNATLFLEEHIKDSHSVFQYSFQANEEDKETVILNDIIEKAISLCEVIENPNAELDNATCPLI